MTSKEEQETTVTWIAADDTVHIYTAVPKHLRKLRGDKRAIRVDGGEDWGMFTLPAKYFDPITGLKHTRKEMTPEQREAVVARLSAAREVRERKAASDGDK